MEVVGSGARHAVDQEPAGAPELRGDAAARNVDLLDVELGEILVRVAEERVRHVHAVVEERVVLPAAARVDADVGGTDDHTGFRDSRRELERPRERPREREFLDRFLGRDRGDVARLGVDDGRRSADLDGRSRRRAERRADLRVLLQRDDDGLLEDAEALELRPDAVFTRRQSGETKAPVGEGRRRPAEGKGRARNRDGGPRKRGPVRPGDDAADRARGLGEQDGARERDENENGKK